MVDDDVQKQLKFGAHQESAEVSPETNSESLWRIADEFRAWVIRDLRALAQTDRLGFRGDYLFIIDGSPLFLVVVTPESVSAARWHSESLVEDGQVLLSDMGDPMQLDSTALKAVANGQVRVSVQTDSLTLRRLLQGTLRAKVAYLSGKVKINGDLPCFMRLVAVLKGRGIAPPSNASAFPK